MDPKSQENSSLVRDFETKKSKFFLSPKIAAIYLIIVAIGIGTGFVLSRGSATSVKQPTDSVSVSEGTTYGSKDTKTFKDSAEGKL